MRYFYCFCLLFCCLFISKTNAQSIGISIADSSVLYGNTIDYPIYIDSSLTGKNVTAFQFKLDCSAQNFTLQNVITTGTISASFGTITFNQNANSILVSGAGANALTGKGVLIYLRIKPLTYNGIYLQFNGISNFSFNQGNPAVNFNKYYASINITARPSINTYYSGSNLTIGDSLQVYASGGQQPYTWSVSNSSVANINQNGMLYAKAAGTTRIIAQSADGIIDTTDQDLQIRALKLTVRDSSFYTVPSIVVPIQINDVNSSNVYSGNFTLEYSQSYLVPDSIIYTGTLLANASISYQILNNKLVISFASATKLIGAGNLLKIRFKIINPMSSWLTLSNCLFNQNIIANTQAGTISFINLPNLGITPYYGDYFTEQTQQFSGYGGKAPYSFKSSDTSIAGINNTGLMTTKSGGLVKIEIKDSLNSTAQTQTLKVYDAEISLPYLPVLGGTKISYPVFISNFNGKKGIYSMQFTIDISGNILDSIQVVTSNTISSNFVLTQNMINGKLYIALAGTSPIRTNGIIFRINAVQNSNAQINSSESFNISSCQINENNFYTKIGSGYLQIVNTITRDIGISSIQSMNSTCTKSNSEQIVAQITNYNNNPFYIGDTIFIGYNLNNGPVQKDTLILNTNLNQGNSLIYSFKKTANLSNAGSYYLKVFTFNKGDINQNNDTTSLQFQVYGNPVVNLGKDTSICKGNSINLNASIPNGRYLWNTNETNASIQVNTTGTYWVKVLSNYDCTATDTIQITTVNAPTSRSISGTPYIGSCGLDSIILTVPIELGMRYRWYKNGNPTLNYKDTLNSFMANQSGTHNVQLTNLFGCSSFMKDTSIVVATSRPASPNILAKTNYCENDTISVDFTSDANLNYLWKGPNGFKQTGTKLIRVNADTTMSGTYQLYAIKKNAVTACDTSNANPIQITVHAKPAKINITYSGSLSYCEKNADSAVLYVKKQIGFSYVWSKNNVLNLADSNSFIAPKQTGQYNVMLTNTYGCNNLMNPLSVEVKSKPITGAISGSTNVVKNSLQTYTVQQTIGSTYQWNVYNGTLQSNIGNSSNVIWNKGIGMGNIGVVETASNGCSGEQQNKMVTIVSAYFTIDTDSINTNHFLQTKYIKIASNTNWTIANSNNWISFNKNSGNGSDSIAITIAYNNDTISRVGQFIFSCDTIEVKVNIVQAGKPPQIDSLLLTIDTIRVGAFSQQATIGILSNTAWQVNSNQNWLTLNKQNGNGNDSLQINIAANADTLARFAIVTVSTIGITRNVWVEQAGKAKHIDSLSLSQDSIFIGPSSQVVNIDLFANTNWSILNPLSWLHLSKSNGNANATIQLQIDSLDNNQTSREGYLFISANAIQKILYIKQSVGTGMQIIKGFQNTSLYPNPANDFIYISNAQNLIESISIFDMNGKKQMQLNNCKDDEPIDISSLKSGIYQVLIIGNANQSTNKLLLINPNH
jgi:hypothetical protein